MRAPQLRARGAKLTPPHLLPAGWHPRTHPGPRQIELAPPAGAAGRLAACLAGGGCWWIQRAYRAGTKPPKTLSARGCVVHPRLLTRSQGRTHTGAIIRLGPTGKAGPEHWLLPLAAGRRRRRRGGSSRRRTYTEHSGGSSPSHVSSGSNAPHTRRAGPSSSHARILRCRRRRRGRAAARTGPCTGGGDGDSASPVSAWWW
eukprot:COSAG01_NODE_8036_length_2946_cov_5.061819_4_plen_201_part_00